MNMSTALRALVFLALAASACAQPPPEPPPSEHPIPEHSTPEQGAAPEEGVPPERGVLYTREPLGGVLIARTREVSVRVEHEGGDGEFERFVLHVETAEGQSARHLWPDDPYQPDEIYLLDGYACGQDLIDVVVRSAPPKHSDIPSFSYVRFLIDEETLELMALVPSDPSVRAASGVAPIQSVMAPIRTPTSPDGPWGTPGGIWPVFSVECDGERVESVTVRNEYRL